MNYNDGPQMPRELEKFLNDLKRNFKKVGSIIIFIVIGLFGLTSFYTVGPDEEAVVIRLGKYVETTLPGLHFKLPMGIDKIIKVRTKRVHQAEFGFRSRQNYNDYSIESLMLTGDLNVADVQWVVQYQISNPFKYIYKTSSPIRNISDVSESIMRRVVGDRLVTEVLTVGRTEIATRAKVLMQEVLDKYDMGVRVVSIKLQDVNPPDMVKPSFNEVNEAKQEQEKVINQAEEAYNKVIPEARGQAEKQISVAKGYSEEVVNRATGDAQKFLAIFREYRKAPKVTRARIYIETMEKIFSKFDNMTIVDPKIKGLLPIYKGAAEREVK